MENEPKYMFSLILYFLFLIFMVVMFNAISFDFGLDAGYNASNTDYGLIQQEGAGGFRFAGASEFGHTHEFLNKDKTPRPYIQLGYIDDQESCEAFHGFEWEAAIKIFAWGVGSETCKGKLDFSYYDPNSTFNDGVSFGRYTIDNICDLPLLDVGDVNNSARQMTSLFQCQWLETQYGTYDGDSSFSVIWESLKDIATFDIEFPIEDTFLKFLVNFLLIGIPAIVLTTYVIILIRNLVGFT